MGEGNSDPVPPGSIVLSKAAARRAAEPSWGRVLATTVKLSALRGLRAIGFGPRRTAGRLSPSQYRLSAWQRRPVAWRWRLSALLLGLVLITVAVLRVTGVFPGTASALPRAAAAGSSPGGNAGAPGTSSLSAARSQAAAWIAAQVSGNAIIACYPDMCAALQAQGVAAGRLMPLQDSVASPLGASVMVTSPLVRSQLDDEYAPALMASFGSGGARIEVRAAEPGRAAAYQAALRADLASRRSAGAQLLRNWRIQFTAPDAAQLRAGEVDSRLLATLAALASQYAFRVTSFSDASPGARVLFREVTITGEARNGAADLGAALAIVRAQAPPYLPAHAVVQTAGGQPALSIEFAAPSPLGLLAAVFLGNERYITMGLRNKLARLAAITTLLGGTAALVAAAAPAASAAAWGSVAPAATQDAWVRIAHLSPKAPAMDIYMYPFGEPGHPIVLRDVSYGDVSAYMAVSPGQYSVAMRGFGAPASSPPALITSFTVTVGTPYTVAALGPDPGLRVEVLKDQITTPTGKALVRVIQASLKEHVVTVSYGPDVLARQLAFGVATSYVAVSPGAQTVQFTASGEHAATSVPLAADTVHTIVVLDDSSGLKVDALVDSAGSQIMPKGGAEAGFGGTAPRLPTDPAPWLLTIAAGALLTSGGFAGLLRSRRRRPVTG